MIAAGPAGYAIAIHQPGREAATFSSKIGFGTCRHWKGSRAPQRGGRMA